MSLEEIQSDLGRFARQDYDWRKGLEVGLDALPEAVARQYLAVIAKQAADLTSSSHNSYKLKFAVDAWCNLSLLLFVFPDFRSTETGRKIFHCCESLKTFHAEVMLRAGYCTVDQDHFVLPPERRDAFVQAFADYIKLFLTWLTEKSDSSHCYEAWLHRFNDQKPVVVVAEPAQLVFARDESYKLGGTPSTHSSLLSGSGASSPASDGKPAPRGRAFSFAHHFSKGASPALLSPSPSPLSASDCSINRADTAETYCAYEC